MRKIILSCLSLLCLTGCAGQPYESYAKDTTPPLISTINNIEPGDMVELLVFAEDDLSGDFTVMDDGFLNLPLIDPIFVLGQTVEQATHNIVDAYKNQKFLIDPKVTLTLKKSAKTVMILGEVINSGEYAYRDGMTILALVAKAGGFSYRARETSFDIIRKNDNGHEDIITGNTSTYIYPDDIIRVGQRYF